MRNTYKRRFFPWELEKEEAWLNEMASNGKVLKEIFLNKYYFENALNDEYTIRLEVLEKSFAHPQSVKI